jgi:hypothetical protein
VRRLESGRVAAWFRECAMMVCEARQPTAAQKVRKIVFRLRSCRPRVSAQRSECLTTKLC